MGTKVENWRSHCALLVSGCTKGAHPTWIYWPNQQKVPFNMPTSTFKLAQGFKSYEHSRSANPHHHFVIDVIINQSLAGIVRVMSWIEANGSLSPTLSPNLDGWKCRVTQLLLYYILNPWANFKVEVSMLKATFCWFYQYIQIGWAPFVHSGASSVRDTHTAAANN